MPHGRLHGGGVVVQNANVCVIYGIVSGVMRLRYKFPSNTSSSFPPLPRRLVPSQGHQARQTFCVE